jgi:phosphate acetyltransferase
MNERRSFLNSLHERARTARARIGFPEADEPRTAKAIRLLAENDLVQPVSVGETDLEPLRPSGDGAGTAVPGMVRPTQELVSRLELEEPTPLRLAVALLRAGELDGVVAGARTTTADVVRAGLRLLGTAPGTETVSSSFYMLFDGPSARPEDVLTFTDPAVVAAPTPMQLAEIADSACRARVAIVGDEPRVAFLSYSTHGSAGGLPVQLVREAVERFRARRPDVLADGELQVDAALVPEVARRKSPDSRIAGMANVLVFPNLDAGNIAYKLVQRLANADALGPILQGLAAPLNDLSRGASVEDIVNVACITAVLKRAESRSEE